MGTIPKSNFKKYSSNMLMTDYLWNKLSSLISGCCFRKRDMPCFVSIMLLLMVYRCFQPFRLWLIKQIWVNYRVFQHSRGTKGFFKNFCFQSLSQEFCGIAYSCLFKLIALNNGEGPHLSGSSDSQIAYLCLNSRKPVNFSNQLRRKQL